MRFIALLALGTLAACMSGGLDEPRQYLLGGSDSTGANAPRPVGQAYVATVALREIALPLYARRDRVAVMESAGVITADDDHIWAEEPPHAATRVLARRLDAVLGQPVFVEPWPPGSSPDVVVSVDVDRFIGAFGDAANLEGQFTIVRSINRGAPETIPFALSAPVTGEGYPGLVDAYGAAIVKLGDMIAAELVRRPVL